MVSPKLPDRINRLDELTLNLWWSWHARARNVFRTLDYQLWKLSGHNPVREMSEVNPYILQAAAADPSFLSLYDSVMAELDSDMKASDTWFAKQYPNLADNPVAYFSMEYAIHNSLPIYAGGLGVLAGDICKEASDLGLPMIAVGFMYPQGYFHQHLCASTDKCQDEIYEQLDFSRAPIKRITTADGNINIASVQLGNETIALGVWRVKVGCTDIYLLDTNLEETPPRHRDLSARLYISDKEQRLQQEIVLGIGGVRVLRALGINPAVWHVNEGHTAFMMLERVRELVTSGISYDEAARIVQSTTVFTTHTPVLAGHDIFPPRMIKNYFNRYWESLGISLNTFLQLGQTDSSSTQNYNMTALALKMSDYRCGVSRLHGTVTRKMWHSLWPNIDEDKVPISHITNGIHVPSWVAPELSFLFEKYLGNDWAKANDDCNMWDNLGDIPDDELWPVHQLLKNKLMSTIRERGRKRWAEGDVTSSEMPAMGTLLDPDVLTIAFCRRFVEYKRPLLIFRDMERLKKIITNGLHPVQIIFAGKSHPADMASKYLIQQVYSIALDNSFQGRIAFVENFNMHLARYLVQGVDVWLNTPRRLREASGTSGMKACLNMVLHMSVRDGWWHEGYNGKNGWAIGGEEPVQKTEDEDAQDSESIYQLLEKEIVPLYYARDRSGVPHGWVRMVKESMLSIVPPFCARRMMKEYAEHMYIPIIKSQIKRH